MGLAAVFSWAFLLSASAAEYAPLTPLPDSYRLHGLAQSDGFLYHVGGLSGTMGIAGARKVFYSRVQTDGALTPWTPGPDLPEITFSHAAAAWNKTLYVIGGQRFTPGVGLGPSNTVYYSRLGADGVPGAWATTTPLPNAAFYLNAAFWQGRLYVTGGWNHVGLLPDVYSAPALPDGTLGAWRPETPLPEGVYTHAAAAEGTLYVLGGVVNGGSEVRNDVYFATIGADGTLGPWTTTSPLPQPLSNLGSVVADGRVFVTGGWTGTAASNATYSAPILADRSLGEWTTYANTPTGRYQHGTASDGKRLFVSGGFTEGVLSDVLAVSLPAPVPPPSTAAPALVVFSPVVLNLSSRGRWVSAYLAFRREFADADDVAPGSAAIIAVNGVPITPIPAAVERRSWGRGNDGNGNNGNHGNGHNGNHGDDDEDDEDDDGGPRLGVAILKLKFDRAKVQAAIASGENRLTVRGRLTDGRTVEGTGRIWGKVRKPIAGRRVKNLAPALKLSENAAQKPVNHEGGEVRAHRAAVRLPEGALPAGVPVTVNEAPTQDEAEKNRQSSAAAKRNVAAVGAAVEYGPHGARFDKPVTIELPFERERLPSGVKESEIAVHYWNAARGDWEALPSIVDGPARVVRAQTTHFSWYQVFSGGNSSPAAAGLAFGDVYAYPNPARGGANPVVRVEAPLADRVELKIYDVTGALRHAATATGTAAAHEFVWDASSVPSGVYFYVARASVAGSGDIVSKGKLAVIK